MKSPDLRQLKAEMLRRIKEEPYQAYVPTGKGEEFINTVMGGKYFITLFSAANGIGKSTVGFNMLAHLIWPCGNKFFQHGYFKKWPFIKRMRIVSDPTNITKNIIPEMKRWFPKGKYKTHKDGKNYEARWVTDNGWTIDIMSTEQDPKEFESVNLGLIWIDEPCPENIYKACVSRLRMGGAMFITATPLTGSAWMYDKIINKSDEEDQEGLRTYIEADVWSACKGHPTAIRGFLEEEHIKRMIAQYDDEDMQARVLGKFQHLTGLVFKKWRRPVHVMRPFKITPEHFTVYEFLDPHPRTEDAVGWYAVDRYGRKYVIDELFINGTTEEIAIRIKEKRAAIGCPIARAMIDPWTFQEDQHTGKSLATRFQEHGLHYLPATKLRSAADRRINEAFDYVDQGGQMVKPPELYVFDNCSRHIYEIEHYRWDDWTGKTAERKGLKQKPIDKDDHEIENLGRFLLQEPTFMEISIEERMAQIGGQALSYGVPYQAETRMSGDPY